MANLLEKTRKIANQRNGLMKQLQVEMPYVDIAWQRRNKNEGYTNPGQGHWVCMNP